MNMSKELKFLIHSYHRDNTAVFNTKIKHFVDSFFARTVEGGIVFKALQDYSKTHPNFDDEPDEVTLQREINELLKGR